MCTRVSWWTCTKLAYDLLPKLYLLEKERKMASFALTAFVVLLWLTPFSDRPVPLPRVLCLAKYTIRSSIQCRDCHQTHNISIYQMRQVLRDVEVNVTLIIWWRNFNWIEGWKAATSSIMHSTSLVMYCIPLHTYHYWRAQLVQ